ncbi:3-oxoacyl-[acyl-carrier-protein] synthase III [Candidatus Liberibacter americanus str. Sao Paulo]|uniref:3-oxopimeloyl-[acyl-carrier-protein] synthase n=1 Tax=Candidatus Liberibacter americanus str. Sao Paulo TaxID=1261131 RepID=U6B363_9HYPH|nr:beta-ketoacyl-ACP synthase III [Candidatus Liberibacter americanus]AHA27499.1 3-oxoacyl-[acyl-carrier-protein] synthase III [Candidatus Liberibacter americanus str. Sao Paulo]
MKTYSRIIGFGHSTPSQCIHNYIIERHLNLKYGTIEQKTGIKSRYWATKEETLTDIAIKAGEMALKEACINKNDIALTLLATSTPDNLLPPSSPLITHKLGLLNSGAIDLTGACSGFLYALVFADNYIRSNKKPVLIIAANLLSKRINMSDKDTAIIFGDAAGSIVLIPSESKDKRGVIGINLMSDGSKYDLIKVPSSGTYTNQKDLNINDFFINLTEGNNIFYSAVKIMTKSAQEALKIAKIKATDINRFIPHQANNRIIQKTYEKIGLSQNTVVNSLSEFGNSSAATIPLSLSLENKRRSFRCGEIILLSAVGAGMTGGSVVFMI